MLLQNNQTVSLPTYYICIGWITQAEYQQEGSQAIRQPAEGCGGCVQETTGVAIIRFVTTTPYSLVMTHPTGSLAVFGVVCENQVALLLDCSASMKNHWQELTNHIESLLIEQLIPRGTW